MIISTQDSTETWKMINCRPLFISLWLITAAASVGGCSVHPTSVVVTVGERVFLACSTNEGSSITSWDIHVAIDSRRKTTVYTAPIYKRDGTVRTPEELAEGYFVTRPANNETTLHMNKTILSQAGLYVCTCDLRSTAEATVVVFDSEPKFTTDYYATDGEPVTFSCSMSFNASSDVSCELKIEDESGFTVARRHESTENNGLIVCNLKHTIIANTCSDQWHSCNVTLSTKGNIIYSRVLTAAVEWLGKTKAERGSDAYQVIAFPITIAVACVIIAILSATTVVLYRKLKQRRSSDALKISTEDNPALYAALDVPTASEEQKRETYTAIQLPIQSQQDLRGDYMNTDISCEYETVT